MADDFDVSAARTEILSRMARALGAAGRPADSAVLVAVSKRQPDARVDAALAAGQRVFGENRVQEALERWTPRRARYPDLQLRLVGALQSNKAKEAAAFFDVVESVDRAKLATALAEGAARSGRELCVYIQVNTGEEPQKSGVAPDALDQLVAHVKSLKALKLKGLMCIPPMEAPAGPHFALLADMAARHGLPELSMGMSADYETALRFGATHVRVGSALFGAREV